MRLSGIVTAIAVLAALSGCQRTTFGGLGAPTSPIIQPQPLSPAPVGGVETNQLPEATDSQFPDAPTSPEAVNIETVAQNAQSLTKEELIGRWTLTSGTQTCDIFLSLTKWTGGFRAASRGCSGSAALISAWDVKGKQVILADSSGATAARLYKTAPERYNGSATSGEAVSMSR